MPDDFRGGLIRDPVHDYILFTPIEDALLRHRVTQRLRYISQNGLAHLVYPEVRTSRFSHTLGAMHLASQFFSSSLHNASEDSKEYIGDALKAIIDEAAGPIVRPERAGSSLPDDGLLAHHHCSPALKPYFLLAEQSLRLAAFFHDLGHLPFSHDFESGLEVYWTELSDSEQASSPLYQFFNPITRHGQEQIHERLGHDLAHLVSQDIYPDLEQTSLGTPARICLQIVKNIFTIESSPDNSSTEAVLLWMRSIVDGELDVDRADYLLRDGRNFGFEFANYDLQRLIAHLQLVKDGDNPILAVAPQATSSVESFLISRFRSYQYGHYHHKVTQVNTALRHSIAFCLKHSADPSIRRFLADIASMGRAASLHPDEVGALLVRFADYDDIWWMGIMRQEAAKHPENEWLALVCWRQDGPVSLWKRRNDFPVQPVANWNARLPPRNDLDGLVRWQEAAAELKSAGVLVVRHTFQPWRMDEQGESRLRIVQRRTGELVPISRLSALIAGLWNAWASDLQVHAFRRSDSALTAQEVVNRLPVGAPERGAV